MVLGLGLGGANISLLNWVGPATVTGLLFWVVVAFKTES